MTKRGRPTTHGMINTFTYKSWEAMKQRCLNKNSPTFKHYGGRGIGICDKWLSSFENFLEDMGERPEGRTLDRIDPDGNYEPLNCQWATSSQQANNKRTSRMFTLDGETKTLGEWCIQYDISRSTVFHRLAKGIDIQTALTEKLDMKQSNNRKKGC